MEIVNLENIRSRRDYNKYEVKYPINFNGFGIKQYLLIETAFMQKSYPDEIKMASSMVYDFLKETNDEEGIREYGLYPYQIRVQVLERTLIEKVYAICDYVISNNIAGHSRHIYDLYKLYDKICFDKKFKSLVAEVREERKKSKYCFSAQDGFDIINMLRKIVDDQLYLKDYKEITEKVLFENISYETAITVIERIINSNVFSK